ncbi:MAG: transglutaminase-like domain-containing protein [archaeon]
MSFQTTIVNKGSSDFDLSSNAYTDPSIPLFSQSGLQDVRLVQSSHPVQARLDQDGNGKGVLQIQMNLRREQTLTLEVQYLASVYHTQQRELWQSRSFDVADSGTVAEIPRAFVDSYCRAAGPWRLNESGASWRRILDLTSQLIEGESNVLAIIVKLVDWVGKNIKYPRDTRDHILLPDETLAHLEGDCDEQSNLLITMLRYARVPAYLQTGALYLPSRDRRSTLLNGHLVASMNSIGWHAWAMVYAPPWGWLPVDMTIGYRQESPLDAITYSAPATLTAIIANSIMTSDYISEGNAAASELQKTGIEIIESQSIEQVVAPRAEDIVPILITVSVLVFFGITILATYFVARARRRARSLSN